MVKQGDIIKVDFNPQSGHEQTGYRPAIIITNDFSNRSNIEECKKCCWQQIIRNNYMRQLGVWVKG